MANSELARLGGGQPIDPAVAAERLRPLSLAEVLDVPFAVLRRRYGAVLLVVIVAAVLPLSVLGRWVTSMVGWMAETGLADPMAGPDPFAQQPPMMSDAESLGWMLTLLIGYTLLVVGVSRLLVAEQVGVRLPALAALFRAPGRLLVVGGWIVLVAVIGLGGLFAVMMALAGLGALAWPLLLLAVPAAIAAGVYLLGAFGLSAVVAAVEPGGPLRALGRALRLSRGARWRLGGVFLAVSLVGALVSYALIGLVNLVGMVSVGLEQPAVVLGVVVAVLVLAYVAGVVIVAPVTLMAYAMAYLDRLVRRDGVDLVALLDAGGQEAGAVR